MIHFWKEQKIWAELLKKVECFKDGKDGEGVSDQECQRVLGEEV